MSTRRKAYWLLVKAAVATVSSDQRCHQQAAWVSARVPTTRAASTAPRFSAPDNWTDRVPAQLVPLPPRVAFDPGRRRGPAVRSRVLDKNQTTLADGQDKQRGRSISIYPLPCRPCTLKALFGFRVKKFTCKRLHVFGKKISSQSQQLHTPTAVGPTNGPSPGPNFPHCYNQTRAIVSTEFFPLHQPNRAKHVVP